MDPTKLDPASLAAASRCHLGRVVSVADPGKKGCVKVRLHAFDGVGDHDAAIWARVVMPFAGAKRGAFFVPEVGDEVLVAFVAGDERQAVVLGSIFNGGTEVPDKLGGAGDRVDRWSLTGTMGTRIAIVETKENQAQIELRTPNGVKATLSDAEGGQVVVECAGTTVRIDKAGVSIKTSGKLKASAASTTIESGTVRVDAAETTFTGLVSAPSIRTGTIAANVYSTGAGNVW